MNQYLKDLSSLIINCNFDNTYKMAWAKSIVEIISELHLEEMEADSEIEIDFERIAQKFIQYYWNQSAYFDLLQGSNIKKQPEILTHTKNLIEAYYTHIGDRKAQNFIKVLPFKSEDLNHQYQLTLKETVKVLKQDVCWRFKNLNGKTIDIYRLDKPNGKIFFRQEHGHFIKENSLLLLQLINYRWTQMLETFNVSPKIAMKVRVTNDNVEIKRASLKKYRTYLDLEFKDREIRCFYCGDIIPENEISLDHVIPWSYMYSDDLWNLVYCHKSENSMKQATLVDEEIILKVEERNKRLLRLLEEKGIDDKNVQELKLSLEKSWLKQFWMSYRGA
ncbi:HNH endonuclease [Turicibacter sanguinis]|uniref:HNH endonuclease domain-containing protein n=1 Tax=Turicibacter sanguinis TaxID=154288 RepID=UPI0006C0D650|nr:HNH endonuclease domain-containing protein [Turicibacter sanguinis]MTN80269.1 HNH endonuclease [Turicibacter sanguinis]MTN83142.1 HNH endonuclease [Turicibacter sanguinis]MTN86080.1 HNH endonuclease [Turicibacter sanguinis]MTN89177.1 HNH endonuclease [Turicibacter sanguinis]MTN91945.1 HNH endonuclease [Turicibacter sanguinis]